MSLKLRVLLILVVCAAILWTTVAVSEESSKPIDLLQRIKYSSNEELGRLIYAYAKKDINADDVVMLSSLLENKDVIRAREEPSDVIYVRDIALVLIEELTGEYFLPAQTTFPVKAILSYKSKNGLDFFRFPVYSLSDKDFETVKPVVARWIAQRVR